MSERRTERKQKKTDKQTPSFSHDTQLFMEALENSSKQNTSEDAQSPIQVFALQPEEMLRSRISHASQLES